MSLQTAPRATAASLGLQPHLEEAVSSRSPLKIRQAAFASNTPENEPVVYTVTLVVVLANEVQ
jgi:hypothetical protein